MGSFIQTLVVLPPIISVMLKITIILGVGWIAHFSLARYNPRWRVLLWRCIIVGIFLVPALMPLKYLQIRITRASEPSVTSRTYSASESVVTFSSGKVPVELTYVTEPVEHDNSYTPQTSFSLLVWLRESMWTIAFSLWGIVAAILTSRLFVGFIRIKKRINTSLPGPNHLQRLLDQVASDLDCRRKVVLHHSPELFTPFLSGYRRPVVVLPERMINDEYTAESPAIFAHEVAHLCSGDLFWMFAARFVGVLLWFHPLVWKLRDAHNAACEEVCDAVAADYVGNTELYSSALARVALDMMGMLMAVGAIPMVRSSDILTRLRILKRKVYSSRLAGRWVTLSVLTGMAVFVCLGGIKLAYAEIDVAMEEQNEELTSQLTESGGKLWEEMGRNSASEGGISNDEGESMSPAIAIVEDNNPVVCWVNDDPNTRFQIYVKHWNGDNWVELGTSSASGGGISSTIVDSFHPEIIIDRKGNPII
ncbi:M56 family metallopeptidase, partial [Planctomycetota bacterium]